MTTWPGGITAVTLFVEDLNHAKEFYQNAFGLPIHFEDDDSAVFAFDGTLINLLKTSAAHELIEPAIVETSNTIHRSQFTLQVDDVDARCAELTSRGIELLNGPMDRPRGNQNRQFPGPGRPHLGDRAVTSVARSPGTVNQARC